MKKKLNFIEELGRLKKPVRHVLAKYFPTKIPFGHYKMIKEYPSREGKYLRPGLLLLGIEMFGGNMKDGILAAAAIQASEDWLLIHDDMEDHSEHRRRKPTLNVLYGEELAVNAGDALHIIMWRIMADFVRQYRNSKVGWKIFNKLNDALLYATEGQYLELEWIRKGRTSVSETEYLDMVKRKTAYYTIVCPLQIGAIIAGAPEKEIKKIEAWGVPFGYAFQITDDCLNVSVQNDKYGKEFAGDIMEGKRTLLTSHLFSSATTVEKQTIKRIYEKSRPKKTEKDKKFILKLMRKYESDKYAKAQAQMYAQKARGIFMKSTSHLGNTRAREIIASGIDFAWKRES